MRTAEEVLRDFIPPPTTIGEKNDDNHIIMAMEEYANQFKPKLCSTCGKNENEYCSNSFHLTPTNDKKE